MPRQYAPWIEDPDPEQKPMSDQELQAAAEATKKLMQQKRQEDAQRRADK